jgi:tRNA (guanine37-N1)-methyltransferase
MRMAIVTLFPELFDPFTKTSFVGRAVKGGQLMLEFRSPRDFGLGKHKSVDDTPYGGGSGMVMRVDVLVACIESVECEPRARKILLTPQGRPFDQGKASELALP